MNRRQIEALNSLDIKTEKYHIPKHPCWGIRFFDGWNGDTLFVIEQFVDRPGRKFYLGQLRSTEEEQAKFVGTYPTQREAIAAGILKYVVSGG